ncbi:MAG: RsmE family RNA methyltransferase [Polyangiaceae bacterium]
MLRVPLDLEGAASTIELPAESARYVLRVHRLSVGDAFVAFDPIAKTEADATLVSIERDRAAVRLSLSRPSTRLPRRRVTLFQGLAKAEKMDAIVRDATELGATAIVAVRLARSIPSQKSDAALARWRRVAVEAARQCGRGDVPEIGAPVALDEALDADVALRWALAPDAERSLAEIAREAPKDAAVGIFVGPEGGFDREELDRLGQRGAVFARLGAFVLRTETAATAALGVLAATA